MKNKQHSVLASEFLKNSSLDEMINFLQGILTSKELSELNMRIEIVKMLKAGTPHRLIADKLGVGVATVTRGSKELQLGRFKYV